MMRFEIRKTRILQGNREWHFDPLFANTLSDALQVIQAETDGDVSLRQSAVPGRYEAHGNLGTMRYTVIDRLLGG